MVLVETPFGDCERHPIPLVSFNAKIGERATSHTRPVSFSFRPSARGYSRIEKAIAALTNQSSEPE